MRILNNPYYPPMMRNSIYYIPMRVGFLEMEGLSFIDELVKKIDDQEPASQI